MWGELYGHTATDGYSFDVESYTEQGLNAIDASLSISQDAARAYYGNDARMPSREQIQELLQYCTIRRIDTDVLEFTSSVNGESIVVYAGGFMNGTSISTSGELRVWSRTFYTERNAYALQSADINMSVSLSVRDHGLNIMAIHS